MLGPIFSACAFAPTVPPDLLPFGRLRAARAVVHSINMAATDDGMIRETFDSVYDGMPDMTRQNSRFVYGSVPSAIWDQACKSNTDQHRSNAPSAAPPSTTYQPSRRATPGLPLNDGDRSTGHVPAVWRRLAARQAAKLKEIEQPRSPADSTAASAPFATTKPAAPTSAVINEVNGLVLADNHDSREFVYASIPSRIWDGARSMQGYYKRSGTP